MQLDISWLTPRLAIGGHVPEDAIERMARSLRLGQVVDLRAEATIDPALWSAYGIRFLSLPTVDHAAIAPRMLLRGVRFVRSALEQESQVLVHCQFGIGRSVLLACCVLVSQGQTPCEALALAKRVRPIVSPSPDQLHALLNFATHWQRRQGEPPLTTSWHDLASIAYRGVHAEKAVEER
jgi:protein-tyrosine phosphatase